MNGKQDKHTDNKDLIRVHIFYQLASILFIVKMMESHSAHLLSAEISSICPIMPLVPWKASPQMH